MFTFERKWKAKAIHCRFCDTEHEKCPKCGKRFGHATEKTVDSRIVTDLMGLAWESAYDVALLVSSDKDFIPAVERLQTKDFRIINFTWKGQGRDLANTCWSSLDLDDFIQLLQRS